MIVAIHQPNFLPWLGYFGKIAQSDVFVFLDDAQYSKNSYINRVKVMGPSGAKWLTVPVSYGFGDPICQVRPARLDWTSQHLDTLLNYYRSASCFKAVWPELTDLYEGVAEMDLASTNRGLIEAVVARLDLACRFTASSAIPTDGLASDDRLVELVVSIDPHGTYLSGGGGAGYQDPGKFADAGVALEYTEFRHPRYDQGATDFTEGLSVLDAVFHLGWTGAADLILETIRP